MEQRALLRAGRSVGLAAGVSPWCQNESW